MLPVSLIAVGLDARKISPFSLATMTGTVYDSSGVSYIVPTPIISLVFFRGKTFIPPIPATPANVVISQVGDNVNLSWSVSQYATSYEVKFYRSLVNSLDLSKGVNYSTVDTPATSLTSPMSTSTIYFYYATITARNFARDSPTVKTPYAISYGSGCVTIAGSPGIFGTVNGYGEENRYYIPLFGSIDTDGNLYISSAYANVIQKLTIPGCQGSTFSPTTNIASPRGSVVYNGFLYVCDDSIGIRRISLSGGSATTFATVDKAAYITSDGAGGFYVSTQNNGILYQINSSGGVSQRTISGYNHISGIAFHPPTGDIYFSNVPPGNTSSSFARLPAGSSTAVLIQGGNDFSSGVKMNYNNTAVYYSVTNDCTVRKYIIATGAIISIVGSVNDNRHIDSLIMSNVRINNAYDIILMNDGLGMYILDQGGAGQTVRKVIFGDDPPPAPTNLQLSYNIGDTTMSVSYGTVTGATSYSGEFYSTTLDSSGNVAISTATSVQGPTTLATTSFTSTFTILRNRYYYAIIKSTNANGSSASRSPIVYSGLDSPTGVAMGAYTSGATSISVSWTSVEGATSYTVNFYSSGNPNAPVQIFTSVTLLTQTSTFSLATNTTYYASVRANNTLASSTFEQSTNNITTAPSSPTGVTMAAYTSGATSISVSWTSVPGATSYTVRFYQTGNPNTLVQTFTSVTSLTQASSFTLVVANTYYASVRANNLLLFSEFQQSSNTITVLNIPSIVNPISAVAGNGEVTLSWSAPDNGGSAITGYTVKHANGTVIITTTNTSYTVTGLTNGTSYTFIVVANNSVGSSSPSSSPSATPVAPVNNLKITSVVNSPFAFPLTFTDYRANYATMNGNGGIPSINYTYQMTGGNSSPIYIYYDTSPINGTTGIQLNNVYYDNLGDISVYFPNGIVNATSAHYNAFNGGYMQISQTEPVDKQRARARQDANGNPIGSPTRY